MQNQAEKKEIMNQLQKGSMRSVTSRKSFIGGTLFKKSSEDKSLNLSPLDASPNINNSEVFPSQEPLINPFCKYKYNIVFNQVYDTVYIPTIKKDNEETNAFLIDNFQAIQVLKKNLVYWLSQNEKLSTEEFESQEKCFVNNMGMEQVISSSGVLNFFIEEGLSSSIDVLVYGDSMVRLKSIADYYKLYRVTELFFFAHDKDRLCYSLNTKNKVKYINNFLGTKHRGNLWFVSY